MAVAWTGHASALLVAIVPLSWSRRRVIGIGMRTSAGSCTMPGTIRGRQAQS
jgi:hypothetical protein